MKTEALEEGEEEVFSGLIKTLKLLNVSKNLVTDAGAKIIASFI